MKYKVGDFFKWEGSTQYIYKVTAVNFDKKEYNFYFIKNRNYEWSNYPADIAEANSTLYNLSKLEKAIT